MATNPDIPTPSLEPRETKNEPTREDYSRQGENWHGARGAADHRFLYGDTKTWEPWRKKEKPVHVTMASMAAQGYNSIEIGKFVGYNPHTVNKIIRQPFARERIKEIAFKSVQDELREILEKEAIPSIRTLVEVRDDASARKSDRVSASNALLDRFLGKPTQPIMTNAKPLSEKTDAELMDEVRREMAASTPN